MISHLCNKIAHDSAIIEAHSGTVRVEDASNANLCYEEKYNLYV